MRRTIPDVIRRGFDNALANWPLALLRFAENVVNILVILGSIAAVVVPAIASFATVDWSAKDPSEAAQFVLDLLTEHWMLFVWIFIVATISSIVAIAIHSFVVGGASRILVDAERKAAPEGTRERFENFTFERWLAGGRALWWPIFWIYNIAYCVAFTILLLPLVLFGAVILAATLAEMTPVAIVAGCITIPILIFLTVVCTVGASVWSLKAVIVCAEQRTDARTSLRIAWAATKSDLARHFVVALIMLVITVGVGGAVSMVTTPFSMVTSPHSLRDLGFIFLPARMLIMAVQSLFSSMVWLWFTGSFAALSESR